MWAFDEERTFGEEIVMMMTRVLVVDMGTGHTHTHIMSTLFINYLTFHVCVLLIAAPAFLN